MKPFGTPWRQRLAIGSAQMHEVGQSLLMGGENADAAFGIRDPSFLQTPNGDL